MGLVVEGQGGGIGLVFELFKPSIPQGVIDILATGEKWCEQGSTSTLTVSEYPLC